MKREFTDHDAYLKDLQTRAQRLLEMASSSSSTSSHHPTPSPSPHHQHSHHNSPSPSPLPKTLGDRDLMHRLLTQNTQISSLQRKLRQCQFENQQLKGQLKMKKGMKEELLAEELARFKREQRGIIEREVKVWAQKVKLAEEAAQREVSRIQEVMRDKESRLEKAERKYRQQKQKMKKMVEFIERQMPTLEAQLRKSLDMVDKEILRATNPWLQQ